MACTGNNSEDRLVQHWYYRETNSRQQTHHQNKLYCYFRHPTCRVNASTKAGSHESKQGRSLAVVGFQTKDNIIASLFGTMMGIDTTPNDANRGVAAIGRMAAAMPSPGFHDGKEGPATVEGKTGF